jgi:hypothetical protein
LIGVASEINRGLSDASPHAVRVKYLLAWAHALAGEYRSAERLINEAMTREAYGPDPRRLLPSLWLDGLNHVEDVISRCERLLQSDLLPRTASSCFRALAIARAMNGEFTVARGLCRRNAQILEELGLTVLLAALLARVLLEQGRDDEVALLLESGHEASAIEISSRVHFRGIRARLLARRGLERQAQLVGSEAVDMADRTESLDMQAGARLDLAHVFNDCRSCQNATVLIRDAIDLYERKGNMVEAAKAQLMLDS